MATQFQESAGAALVSNTLVCESSRLPAGPPDRKVYERELSAGSFKRSKLIRVLDLMSLIESLVLHDKLYTLPASLPSDTWGLELRNVLISNKALHELNTTPVHKKIGNFIIQSLWAAKNPKKNQYWPSRRRRHPCWGCGN